jgi:nucleotide-binding universal stress UspA family protein
VTISKSIELAEATGLPLYFLYVVNLDFLTRTSSTRMHTISREMRQMGEFILLTAQTTAMTRGITAEGIVRQGKVGEEIIGLCHELSADYLVLGQPRLQQEENVFNHELLREFIEQTEKQTGARVIVPEGGRE